MNHDKKCIHFRDSFHEFLIEPLSAPPELLSEWEMHEAECQECKQLFKRLQNEQNYVGDLVCAAFSQSVRPGKNRSFFLNSSWRGLGWCIATLMLVVGSVSTISFLQRSNKKEEGNVKENTVVALIPDDHKKDSHEQELVTIVRHIYEHLEKNNREVNLEKEKIQLAALLTKNKEKLSENRIDTQIFSTVVKHVFEHVQKIRKEFSALCRLTNQYQNSHEGREVPFLELRLKLYCRLALINSIDREKLTALEKQEHSIHSLENIFGLPKIGCDNVGKLTLCFFRKASPHILSILRYRDSLLQKLGEFNVQNLGGEIATMALIENIEQSVFEF